MKRQVRFGFERMKEERSYQVAWKTPAGIFEFIGVVRVNEKHSSRWEAIDLVGELVGWMSTRDGAAELLTGIWAPKSLIGDAK